MADALEVTPAELDAFADRLGEVESYLHLDEKRTHVTELEAKSVAPGFWDDADAARATMEEIARAKEDIAAVDTARGELSDAARRWNLPRKWAMTPMPLHCVRRLPPRLIVWRAPSMSSNFRAGLPASSITVTRL